MAGFFSFAQSLLDLVFPPRCVNCHTLGALLCENCRATIAIPQPPLCARCGRPLPATRSDSQCGQCASGHQSSPHDKPTRRDRLRWRNPRSNPGLQVPWRPPPGRAARRRWWQAYQAERLTADLVTHVPLHAHVAASAATINRS